MNPTENQNGNCKASSILIVHSSRLMRDSLEYQLKADDFSVAAVRSCTEAVEVSGRLHPALILTGTSFPDGDLLSLVRSLRTAAPAPIFLVIGDGRPEEFKMALDAGAAGYLGAEARIEELRDAVRSILTGGLIVAGVDRKMFAFKENRPSSHLSSITPREREIIAYLCEGRSNREIGERLFISEHTVRTHVQNIRAKLNVRSKLEVALVALGMGISSSHLGEKGVAVTENGDGDSYIASKGGSTGSNGKAALNGAAKGAEAAHGAYANGKAFLVETVRR